MSERSRPAPSAPQEQAAGASGLLTTAIQLSRAAGMAVFAVTLACGAVAAVPLARTVRWAARQAS